MEKYTLKQLKTKFEELGYSWPVFHLVGIRSNANAKNEFDDMIGVIERDNITWYSCTTNPGTHWLQNLLNPKGTAVLVPGQYDDCWQIGLHQGKYEALVQAKPIKVYRDADRDDIAEETSVIDEGMFGINIHRANPSLVSKIIDKWSAGCQVLNDPKQFAQLLEKCKRSGFRRFTYTLLKEF